MKKLFSYSGLLVLLVLFVAFNVLTGTTVTAARADLTENKLYTLSDGTKNILAKLDEPIRLHYYFSKSLSDKASGISDFARRVQELLEEYAAHAHGNIELTVADPEPFSETEDQAVAAGLKGVPATAAGDMFYFGLVGTNATDQVEVIPFFQENREEFLEYDVTKIVYNLSHPKKKVVGILTALPIDGNPMARFMGGKDDQQPWVITEQLRESFDVRVLPATTEKLDADIDVLMVVHPQKLAPRVLFAIDQFVLGGGKVLAFVDPYCETMNVPQNPQNPLDAMMADRSSSLAPLLDAWGLEMPAEDLAADRELALTVAPQGKRVEYVLFLALRTDKDCFSKEDSATSQLEKLVTTTPGFLRKKEGAATTIAPLLQTTKSSMRVPKTKIQFGPNPAELLESFQSSGERLMLAARVNGPAKTAYPEGRPKAEGADAKPEDNAPVEALKESKGPINVIVVADADMLDDSRWVQVQNFFGQKIAIPNADNSKFVLNCVENLSGSNDLISLRSRGRYTRPFDKVVELRREVDAKFSQKEKDLQAKLKDAETRITELQANKDGSDALILSPEAQKEIQRFRDERDKTRKELRAVKYELGRDIDKLKSRLIGVNAALVPAIVLIAGLGVWAHRRKKMREARERGLGG